jgi:hypothetical protein
MNYRTFDCVLVANGADVLPENPEHAFSWKVESWIISFWENRGDDSQANGFSIPGRSDASNSCHLWQFRTLNHYLRFCDDRVIAAMIPVVLSSFWT